MRRLKCCLNAGEIAHHPFQMCKSFWNENMIRSHGMPPLIAQWHLWRSWHTLLGKLKDIFEFVRLPDSTSSIFENTPLNYPKPANSRILGICTGVLAAVAVASCDSLTSLIPLAVEIVRIAFRVGHCVARMADMLEQGPNAQLSWSTVVLGVGGSMATTAIETFNLEQVCRPSCS